MVYIGSIIIFGLPLWPILPQMRLLARAKKQFRDLLHDVVAARKEQLARGLDGEKDDCLAAMLHEKMSEEEMLSHFITLVSAGHDTTTYFLSYMTYLLAMHPDVQDKLYTHLMAIIGDKETVTAEDFGEMRYLHYIMMETLRLYAIIPCVTRVASEDVHIKEANITIPKGTNLLCPIAVLNRDPEIWDQPAQFLPERFQEKGTDFTSAKDGFFPFAYGARTCIGNVFAQIEAGIVLALLLKDYRFEPQPGFRPFIMVGISLTNSNGVKIILKKR
jgi:cytochrome P450